jgi:PadR family transcriptional regulator, regulatory protein PadR
MSDHSLGVLEELILLILLSEGKTYGVEVAKAYESNYNTSISLPAIHVVLKRLEKKGFVKSAFGEPTTERGGRRKRYYEATHLGFQLARDLHESRSKVWTRIPSTSLKIVHA